MDLTVSLEWDSDENVFNVSVPALPGCYSWGKTERQAIANIKDAILVYLEVSARYGDPIHVDTKLATVHVP